MPAPTNPTPEELARRLGSRSPHVRERFELALSEAEAAALQRSLQHPLLEESLRSLRIELPTAFFGRRVLASDRLTQRERELSKFRIWRQRQKVAQMMATEVARNAKLAETAATKLARNAKPAEKKDAEVARDAKPDEKADAVDFPTQMRFWASCVERWLTIGRYATARIHDAQESSSIEKLFLGGSEGAPDSVKNASLKHPLLNVDGSAGLRIVLADRLFNLLNDDLKSRDEAASVAVFANVPVNAPPVTPCPAVLATLPGLAAIGLKDPQAQTLADAITLWEGHTLPALDPAPMPPFADLDSDLRKLILEKGALEELADRIEEEEDALYARKDRMLLAMIGRMLESHAHALGLRKALYLGALDHLATVHPRDSDELHDALAAFGLMDVDDSPEARAAREASQASGHLEEKKKPTTGPLKFKHGRLSEFGRQEEGGKWTLELPADPRLFFELLIRTLLQDAEDRMSDLKAAESKVMFGASEPDEPDGR